MAPNIHTLHDSSNPQPQGPKTFKDRYCPGMHAFGHFRPEAFDPRNRDRDDTIRRSCMLATIGCSTLLDLLSLFFLLIALDVMGFVIKAIFALIGLNFMLWALPVIADAEGERVVLGKTIGRRHFDVFLAFCAGMYTLALFGFLFGIGGFSGFVLGMVPLPLWILIFIVAWVATWDTRTISMA